MKLRHRLLPILALLVGAAVVQHADAATSLTVNCTFTISKDVTIVWTGAGALSGVSGTGNITWNIGAATLNTVYSTVGNGTVADGWIGVDKTADTLKITNNSLTGDGVVLALTASTSNWTVAATTGTVNQYVAACTANDTPPANSQAVITAGALAAGSNAFVADLTAGSSTGALWFAIKTPSTINIGGGALKTIAFVFVGTAF